MAKKSLLRKTASSKTSQDFLANEVVADRSALMVPIKLIKIEKNIRRELTNIDELTESIREHGILQPLVVKKGWKLVSGHRRLESAKRAGIEMVPVRLADMDENTTDITRVVENIQRDNLSGMDEVQAVAELLPVFEGNKAALAQSLGKSRSYVSRCCKAAQVVQVLGDRAPAHALSKSALFELAASENPKAVLESAKDGKKESIRKAKDPRKPSGAVAGGRYGSEGFLQYKERKTGFSFRLNVDVERTPPASVDKAIQQVERILEKLKNMKGKT